MIEGAWLVEDHMHGGWSMAINDEHSDSLITTKLPLSPPVPLAVLTLNSCALSWVLTIVLALIIWWSLLQSFSIKQFSQATHSDRLCTFTAQALNSSVELHTVTDYALSLPAMPQIYQWWEHHQAITTFRVSTNGFPPALHNWMVSTCTGWGGNVWYTKDSAHLLTGLSSGLYGDPKILALCRGTRAIQRRYLKFNNQ